MDDSLQSKLLALGVKLGFADQSVPATDHNTFSVEKLFTGEVSSNQFGECYTVRKNYPPDYIHGSIDLTSRPRLSFIADYCHLPELSNSGSDKLVFLDTETTGLSSNAGTFPFLTGLCKSTQTGAEVALLLCRTQSDEPAMLEELYRYVSGASAIVTYNGKSFDIPLLESRYALYAMRSPFRELGHIDLLQITREIWKRTLPSRSLGHIEMAILGFPRTQDEVPGYLIPQIYYDYLKSRDARPLTGVLYHNEMDILSLIGLLNHLLSKSNDEIEHLNPADIQSIVSLVIKSGDFSRLPYLIEQVLLLPDSEVNWSAFHKLCAWLKSNHQTELALELFNKAALAGEAWAALELAKYYEYHQKDYSQAISWCETYEFHLEIHSLSPYSKSVQMAEIQKRKNRIKSKLGRSS